MTINFLNGISVEAVLLSRGENFIRALLQGADDVTEFVRVKDVWISDDCEPARIVFAWQHVDRHPPQTVDDFCCSHELASKLIHLLVAGDAGALEPCVLPATELSTLPTALAT